MTTACIAILVAGGSDYARMTGAVGVLTHLAAHVLALMAAGLPSAWARGRSAGAAWAMARDQGLARRLVG